MQESSRVKAFASKEGRTPQFQSIFAMHEPYCSIQHKQEENERKSKSKSDSESDCDLKSNSDSGEFKLVAEVCGLVSDMSVGESKVRGREGIVAEDVSAVAEREGVAQQR